MTTTPTIDERSAPAAALAMAQQALMDFPWCFWFRSKAASVATVSEVRLIVQRLRQHGGRDAWARAYQIEQCL